MSRLPAVCLGHAGSARPGSAPACDLLQPGPPRAAEAGSHAQQASAPEPPSSLASPAAAVRAPWASCFASVNALGPLLPEEPPCVPGASQEGCLSSALRSLLLIPLVSAQMPFPFRAHSEPLLNLVLSLHYSP